MIEKGNFLEISDDGIYRSYKRFLDKIKSDDNLEKEVENVRRDIYECRSVGT